LEIAGSWFPSTVQQALAQASSSAMRDTLFLAAWVRLEALGKAMGLGIADRLRGEPAIAPTGGAMHREGRLWHVHAPAIAGAAHAALVIEAADVRVVPEGAPPGFPPFRA
jgi:hypothetical protein